MKWKLLAKALEGVQTVSRDARDVRRNPVSYKLITFTEASKGAYATSVYLQAPSEDSVDVKLIFSKSRLAPIKGNLTIHRMELMGVLIGCRSAMYGANNLGIAPSDVSIFTASKCVVEWCKTFKRFVSRRIKEIRDYKFGINYVKAAEYPADITSRGCTVNQIKESELWWNGPKWVTLARYALPKFPYVIAEDMRSMTDSEEKGSKILFEAGRMAGVFDESQSLLDINIEQYSSD